jgi:GLPGLI family protein
MKLKTLAFLLLIIATPHMELVAQHKSEFAFVVEYEYFRIPETSPFKILYNSRLVANDSISSYEIELKNTDSVRIMRTDKGSYRMINEGKNSFYFKNLYKNVLLNEERILLRKILVEDSLTIFNWTITGNSRTVLGYQCQEAVTRFRGRDYVAFFASAIASNNGPWKFHGLPGLILVVETSDKNFTITAKSFRLLNEKLPIIYPFPSDKSMSRADFEKLYIQKYNETNSYRGENNSTMKMPKGLIEIIVVD